LEKRIRFALENYPELMDIVASGIRSTGNLHLGNYFGAIRNFLKMQKENKCFFFIADYHSLTTHPKPDHLHDNIKQVLAEYLAPDNINAGLLTYPVLMAADIIIHKANKVPVGKDQEQHLEMTRRFARRFNTMYGVDYFPEPDAYNFGKQLIKIPGLDGTGKMGKSEGNGIFLADTPTEIRKKVMKAVTDTGPVTPGRRPSGPVKNLFTIMNVVSDHSTVKYFTEKYSTCEIRYGEMKKQLAEDIIKATDPIRDRINDILKDRKYLAKVVSEGAEKARASASKTVREVREIIGYKPF